MARKARWPFVEETQNGYRASVRTKHGRVKGEVRETAEQAHQDAVRIRDQRAAGIDPTKPTTIGQALASILRDCERRERREATSEFYKSHLGVWINHLGTDHRLASITVEEVQRFVDARRAKGIAGLTIKHDLAGLRRACRLLGVPDPTKSPTLIRPKVQKRDPHLRMAWTEVMDVLRKLSGHEIELAVVGFTAGTGLRRAEWGRLLRKSVDTVGRRLMIDGKTEPRTIPLPQVKSVEECLEVLMALNKKGEFVLPGETDRQRVEWLRQAVLRARIRTGMERLELHELRRCFASRVAEKFPVPVVSALLGHALPGVTGLYVLADQKALLAAMTDLWSEFDRG